MANKSLRLDRSGERLVAKMFDPMGYLIIDGLKIAHISSKGSSSCSQFTAMLAPTVWLTLPPEALVGSPAFPVTHRIGPDVPACWSDLLVGRLLFGVRY